MADPLTVERLVAGGDGLAREADGRVVFVRGGAPGDVVEPRFVRQKKDFAVAEIAALVVASPDRTEPGCPHVERGCGGCDWQHLGLDAQRRAKVAIVEESARRLGRVKLTVDRVVELAEWDFRTSIRLLVDHGRIGYRRRWSHDLVDVDACPIADPVLSTLLADLVVTGSGEVSLHRSASTGEVVVIPHGGVSVVRGLPANATVVTGRPGEGVRTERIAGSELRVSPGSFFQTRPDGAEALVAEVGRLLDGVELGHFVDLYGGVGLFACTVGRRAAHVTLVESSGSACEDARTNMASLPVASDVVCIDVDAWPGAEADTVVADPPRSGLGPAGVAVIVATSPERVVLVSCDGAAFGRDAGLLARAGYTCVTVTLVDLFPQSSHLEVISLFAR